MSFTSIVRLILGLVFIYLGMSCVIKREVTGEADSTLFTKGIYNHGKPYFKITGTPAVVLGLLQIAFGAYALFLLIFDK